MYQGVLQRVLEIEANMFDFDLALDSVTLVIKFEARSILDASPNVGSNGTAVLICYGTVLICYISCTV